MSLPPTVVLAIFDIDQTVVRGDSFKRFCWFAARSHGISMYQLWRSALDILAHPVSLFDAGSLKKLCLKTCLLNSDETEPATVADNFVDRLLLKRVQTTAIDRLRWHKQQNHTLVFLSASPDLYLNVLGLRLGVDRVVCTKVLDFDGSFTGKLYGPNCRGIEKGRRLEAEFSAAKIAWNQSYGYGNSIEDAPFLELLGHPVAVNPDRRLRRLAVKRNWLVESWS